MDISKRKNDSGDPNDIERELTNKFLNGELSFAEYSEQWGESNYAEDGENNESDEEEDESDISRVVSESNKASSSGGRKKARTEGEGARNRNRRFRRQLPPALVGLMGEANLRYARGEKDLAEKMCYEIIRQVPTASEPFHTLAQINEKDVEKSLQFSLIAAHLSPTDSEQWMRLAAISKERGDPKQEIICYTRAINGNPKHLPYHMKRIEAMKELEAKGPVSSSFNLSSQQCYMRLLGILPLSDGPTILSIAKTVARQYHSENKIFKALQAMNIAYDKCPNLFSMEDLNLYLELLIVIKKYDKCLEIFVERGGVDIEAEVQTVCENGVLEDITHVLSCNIPPLLPIDLRSKLTICLIHMKAYQVMDSLIDALLENEDVETSGDIYLDVEEALTSEGRHEEALRLLSPLVRSSRFSLPAVWLKYAQSLTALGRNQEAIEPFKTVIRLAPQHLEARMKLSNILKDMNRLDEATLALEQNPQTDVLDTALLYERCQIYKSIGDLDSYLKVGQILLSRHFFTIRDRDEVSAFRSKDCPDLLKILREAKGDEMEEPDDYTFDESTNQLSLQTEWELLKELLKIAQDFGYYSVMERLAFSAVSSKKFAQYRSTLELICLIACLCNEDYYFAYNLVRDFVQKAPEKPKVWNMLNLVIQRVDDTRHNRFLMRLLVRLGNTDKFLHVLHGNNCLMAGSYKYALKEFMTIYEEHKSPLVALLAGITMSHMACQKFSTNKHTLVIQSIAFLSYYENLRGPDGRQEVYYNIGRAYHQIGIIQKAAEYYKKALKVNIDLINENPEILDLTKEIAFNLHLIYKNDSPEVAQMYLEKYIVI